MTRCRCSAEIDVNKNATFEKEFLRADAAPLARPHHRQNRGAADHVARSPCRRELYRQLGLADFIVEHGRKAIATVSIPACQSTKSEAVAL